jgi:hypothetical protein
LEAKGKLMEAKPLIKPFEDVYASFKESVRILRKLKYNA